MFWSYPPAKYLFLGSKDKIQYDIIIEIRSYNLKNDDLISSHTYFEEIELNNNSFVKVIRIIFLESIFQFYGIFSIKVYKFYLPNLIISGIKYKNEEMCLTYDETNLLFLRNCTDIFLSNFSFLWIIYQDNTIRPFINHTLCIQLDLMKEREENKINFIGDLTLNFCKFSENRIENKEFEDIENKIYNDSYNTKNSVLRSLKNVDILYLIQRSQIYFIEKMSIRMKFFKELCLTTNLDTSLNLGSILSYINSTSNHPNHEIEKILDSKDIFNYWVSKSGSSLPIIIEV